MSEDNAVTVPKPQIAAGGALAGIAPQSIEEAFRLSQALSRAGDMVPANFKGKPDEIMAAMLRGAEIGLMPMQALANIAVINGRASLWGDALPALVQRAGHHIDVELFEDEKDEDATYAEATLTRGDTGKVIKRTFGVRDAKMAGLWNKQGPWKSYPKRMLMHRARAWAVRDGAADALMGLQVAEEMQDVQMRDVTPKPQGSNLAQRLQSLKKPEVQEPEEVKVEIDKNEFAYAEGRQSYLNGENNDPPYVDDEYAQAHWVAGYTDAEQSDAAE